MLLHAMRLCVCVYRDRGAWTLRQSRLHRGIAVYSTTATRHSVTSDDLDVKT